MAEIIYECCRDCRLLDVCDPNYNGEPPCFQKAVESQTTAVQQLQAKIAALADKAEGSPTGNYYGMPMFCLIEQMRQLSAMQ